jgi:hypothetical protein
MYIYKIMKQSLNLNKGKTMLSILQIDVYLQSDIDKNYVLSWKHDSGGTKDPSIDCGSMKEY